MISVLQLDTIFLVTRKERDGKYEEDIPIEIRVESFWPLKKICVRAYQNDATRRYAYLEQ